MPTEDWNTSDELCAARIMEPVEGARYLEVHEEGGDILGVSPTILAPRETEIVKSTYKYDPDWGEDGTGIPHIPSIICSTLLLWAPSYGNFHAPSAPIFLFNIDGEITNTSKGRSFESTRVSTIDIVFRKLYGNEYEHYYFQ